MSMPMNTGSFARLLYPGINKIFLNKYKEHEPQWTKLFDQYTTRRNFEEDLAVSGFGLMVQKGELAPVTFDSMRQGWQARYLMTTYALGFMISRELMEDNLYSEMSMKKASMLAFSARQTKEIIAANVYNRAFTSGYTGGDGSVLLVSSHPNISGGTYSNVLSTAANISEAALEQACIDIRKYVDDRGNRVNFNPQSLILPVDQEFEIERILKSPLRYGTANNDMNVLKSSGKFPKGVHLNNYLTSTTAWFIRTDCPEGMKYFSRRGLEFTTDNDWDTENAKFKATERYSFGWTDPKALYGTPGV
jgi:hypothetical protein